MNDDPVGMHGPWEWKDSAAAFRDAVREHFAFLERDHGFRLVEETTGTLAGPRHAIDQAPLQPVHNAWTRFRWETPTVEFTFGLAPSRHEIDLLFRRAGDDFRERVDLWHAVRLADPALARRWDEPVWIRGSDSWPEVVPRIARAVREYGGALLRGDADAYEAARRLRYA